MKTAGNRSEVTDPQQEARILEACDLHFNHHWSKKRIGDKFGVVGSTVGRWIKQGVAASLVELRLFPTAEVALQLALSPCVERFGVKDLLVAGANRKRFADAAARYFENRARSKSTVVLDGGRTVSEFVDSLTPGVFSDMRIVPIAADPSSYDVSAFELAAIVSRKYPKSKVLRLPHHPSDELAKRTKDVIAAGKTADFVFLGAGTWKRGQTALEFVRFLGLPRDKLQESYPQIKAVCGYCALDKEGGPVEIQEVDARMPRTLTYTDLKHLAKSHKSKVALLAAGAEKLDCALTVIRARICNTLLIDRELAAALLASMNSEQSE